MHRQQHFSFCNTPYHTDNRPLAQLYAHGARRPMGAPASQGRRRERQGAMMAKIGTHRGPGKGRVAINLAFAWLARAPSEFAPTGTSFLHVTCAVHVNCESPPRCPLLFHQCKYCGDCSCGTTDSKRALLLDRNHIQYTTRYVQVRFTSPSTGRQQQLLSTAVCQTRKVGVI